MLGRGFGQCRLAPFFVKEPTLGRTEHDMQRDASNFRVARRRMELVGLEPTASSLPARRYYQLSYSPEFVICRHSNARETAVRG